MSIRQIYDAGGFAAYPGTVNFKGNLTSAEPVSGATGGLFSIGFADLPAIQDNLTNALWGHDPNNVNNSNPASQVTLVQVSGSTAGTPDRMRTVSSAASSGATVWAGTETTVWTTQTRIVRRSMGERTRGPFLVVHGIINTGSDWRMFRGFCDGVTSEVQVSTQALTNASAYVTTPTRWHSRLLGNCKRDYAVEHVAVIRGNFPFTGTIAGGDLLPTASVLQDLWDGTKTYAGVDLTAANAALNAWMTGSIIDYRPLLNGVLTGMGSSTEAANPLVNTEVVGSSTKFLNTNGGVLVKNWSPLALDDPANEWGWGGAGVRRPDLSGKCGTITALEVKIETWLAGTLVSGLDWQDFDFTATSGALAGTLPAALPVSAVGDGYRVWVRDKANPTVMASTGRRLRVGAIGMMHGQSQGEGTYYRGTSLISAASANQETCAITLQTTSGVKNQQAESGGAWSRPIPCLIKLNSGIDGDPDYPALIASMNQWYGDLPDMPILMLNGCWEGLGLTQNWIPELDAWDASTTPPRPTGAATGSNWFLYGNGQNLSGATNGNNSGILTTCAILSDFGLDFEIYDWATTDAPDYAAFLASYTRHNAKLRTLFSKTPDYPVILAPGGRVGASGTVGNLRKLQEEAATTFAAHYLGAVDGDSQTESDGNPHQLNGTSDLGTGQRRRMAKRMRDAAKLFDPSLTSLGPIPTRWWIDPSDGHYAWVDLAWPDRDLYVPDGVSTDIPLCYVDDGSGTWAWHSDPTVSGAAQTMVADLIGGLIRLRKSDGTTWATSGLYFNYARSIIYDSASGTKFKEQDSYAGAQPPYKVGDMLNRIIYGRSDLESGRGLMLRQNYGPARLGLPLDTAPTGHKLVVAERLPAGTYSVTVEGRDGAGNIDTQVISLNVPGATVYVTPGAGWGGVATDTPPAQGSPSAEGYDAVSVGAWDEVPWQDFTGVKYVGVKAGHGPSAAEYASGVTNNIAKVSFSADNGPWVDVTEETINPDTGILDYVVALNADDFPDGLTEIRAIVYPTTGVPLVLQGTDVSQDVHSMLLNANAGGTLPSTKIYLNPTSGSNTNNGLTEATAVATLSKAKDLIKAAQSNDVGGGVVYCVGGTGYRYGEIAEPFDTNAANRWLTIKPAPGYTREQVVFDTAQAASSGIKCAKTLFDGVSFSAVSISGQTVTAAWWKNCRYTGPGMHANAASSLRGSGWTTLYWTDDGTGGYSDARYGPVDFRLVRGPMDAISATIWNIGEDVLRATRWVLGGRVVNMFRDTQTTWHGDMWSMSVARANVMIYKLRADEQIYGHSFLGDNGAAGIDGMIVMDCSFDLTATGGWGNYVMQMGRPVADQSWIRVNFNNGSINHRIDQQFTATNVNYVDCDGPTPTNRNVTGITYYGGTL